MSEVPARQLELENLIETLSAVWGHGSPDVPGWVAEELTFGQMRLLFYVSKTGPSTMSRIAEWLGVGLPTASGTVDRLEKHGLVARQHRLDDRRVVECQLTDAGRRLIEEIAGVQRKMMRDTLGVLSVDEMGEMARLISIVLERLQARSQLR
jgi:DNA-binding MarR family transcriptional regulator